MRNESETKSSSCLTCVYRENHPLLPPCNLCGKDLKNYVPDQDISIPESGVQMW
jgi:hypothetical protein